jgi:hypothetical protein
MKAAERQRSRWVFISVEIKHNLVTKGKSYVSDKKPLAKGWLNKD